MKTKSIITWACVLLFSATSVFAATLKTEKIKVYGKCESCKTRIEKAAKSVSGVSKASWDESNLVLTVTFDESKTDKKNIEAAIAKVGHDTEDVRATDQAYKALPSCCKYDRPKAN